MGGRRLYQNFRGSALFNNIHIYIYICINYNNRQRRALRLPLSSALRETAKVNDKHDRDASSQHSVLVVQPPSSNTSTTFPAFIDSAFPERAGNQVETLKVTKKSIFTTHRQRRTFRLSPSSVLRTRRATINDACATARQKLATGTTATETHESQSNQAAKGLTVRNIMKRNR